MDISPNCDCHSENDAPIVPDVGMFASFDPVALDLACVTAVNKQAPIEDSRLGDHLKEKVEGKDNLHINHPDTDWESAIEHSVKIGIGKDQYELIEI